MRGLTSKIIRKTVKDFDMKTEQFDILGETVYSFLEELFSVISEEVQYSSFTFDEVLQMGRSSITALIELLEVSSEFICLLDEPSKINTEGICFKIDSGGLTIKASTNEKISNYRQKLKDHIQKNPVYFQKIAEQGLTVFRFVLKTTRTNNQIVVGVSYYDVQLEEQWLYLYDLNYYNPVYSLELVSERSLEKTKRFNELFDKIPLTQSSISEELFSNELGMKLASFQKLFQRQTGCTLHQYHQKRRLIELTKLVFFTDKTISEIIFDMGYNSYNSAYKRIRITFKISFRKIIRFMKNSNIFKL